MATDTSDQVLQLREELRHTREELDRYSEMLLAIQRSILPQQLPSVPGLDVAVHFADADGIGGDFYDMHPVGPDRWAILIADVVGHGPAAAALLAMVHALSSAVRGPEPGPAPATALSLVNRPLATRYLVDSGRFVTAFVGQYEVRTQLLTYSSAGHPCPRLVRGNVVRRLDAASGMPLGISGTSVYEEAIVQLLPGDRLVFFTDGITESTNAMHQIFGDERLDSVVCAPANTAADLLSHIINSVVTFRAGRSVLDDETCLVAIVKPFNNSAIRQGEVVR